ncbi:MAG: hypothetical protein BWZ01_03115 [Deltaproteobacteria bacterium ADurb.BinA179]|nr:MAG: hypothetical protein BWZ01_03115 [Deltaproteobacteria bacterium ADurb.BinA179]
MLLEIYAHELDLVTGVGLGNHGQDRLVESAPHELNLGALCKGFQQGEELRIVLFEPLPERTGVVKGHGDVGVIRQDAQQWQIAVPGALFENAGKVPHGLMRMNTERQIHLFRHATRSFRTFHPVC